MSLKSFFTLALLIQVNVFLLIESASVTTGISNHENKTNNVVNASAFNKTENVTDNSNEEFSVTIYTLKYFYGIPFTISIGKNCTNIPWYLYKKASSVDTHDKCVIIFGRQDCVGTKLKIAPGTKGHSNLGDTDFDKTAASIKSCDPEDINTLPKTNTTTTEEPGKETKLTPS